VYEYRNLSGGERVRRVSADMERMANDQEFELTKEQLRAVFNQLKPHIEQFIKQNKQALREFYSRRSRQEQEKFRSLSKPEQMRQAFQFSMTRSPAQMELIVDTIADALPSDMGAAFRRLPPRAKKARVQAWFRQFHSSARQVGRSGQISEQELANFFAQQLEPEEKERLLALPREDMQRQLERLYRGKMIQHGRHRSREMDRRRPRDGRQRDRFHGSRSPGPPHAQKL